MCNVLFKLLFPILNQGIISCYYIIHGFTSFNILSKLMTQINELSQFLHHLD